MKSSSNRLLGVAVLMTVGAAIGAGCAHHHHHYEEDRVVVVDHHGFRHEGFYDEHRNWHGGYHDERGAFHDDPVDWRR